MKHSVLFYHSPEYTVAFGVLVQAWSQLNIANTCQFTPWIQLKKTPNKQQPTQPPPKKKKKQTTNQNKQNPNKTPQMKKNPKENKPKHLSLRGSILTSFKDGSLSELVNSW